MFKSKKMQIIYIILAIAIIVIGFVFFGAKKRFGSVDFPNHTLSIKVELAQNLGQQVRGLMFRDSLASDQGMLFIFSGEANRTFWMKNVKFPLDLIFISQSGEIKEVKENFATCQGGGKCENYSSANPAKYVLEVNAGFVQNHQIKIGESVNITINSK